MPAIPPMTFAMRKQQSPSVLHGIMRTRPGEQYAKKREAFEFFAAEHGVDLNVLINDVFGGSCFANSRIDKATLVRELLQDELSEENWRFIRDRLRTQPYLTDRRHTEEYAFDIALGWLEEEFVIRQLASALPEDTSIERIGIDASREYLSLNIRATADLRISIGERTVAVDLFIDHMGTWVKNNGIDLKKGKLGHFKKKSLDAVLAIDLVHQRMHLILPKHARGITPVANAAMGGTETSRVPAGKPVMFSDIAAWISEHGADRKQDGRKKR